MYSKTQALPRPVTRGGQGGEAPTRKLSPSLEKCVGHAFKTTGHILKICPPLKKPSSSLVFQAGYGPGSS